VRDTALKLRTEQIAYTKTMLSGIKKVTNTETRPGPANKIISSPEESWNMEVNGKKEGLDWLL